MEISSKEESEIVESLINNKLESIFSSPSPILKLISKNSLWDEPVAVEVWKVWLQKASQNRLTSSLDLMAETLEGLVTSPKDSKFREAAEEMFGVIPQKAFDHCSKSAFSLAQVYLIDPRIDGGAKSIIGSQIDFWKKQPDNHPRPSKDRIKKAFKAYLSLNKV